MKKHSIMAVAMLSAILMGAVSCNDDDESVSEPSNAHVSDSNIPTQKTMTFKAGSETADKSLQKTAYDSDLKMVWQSADNFSIFPSGTTDNVEYSLVSGENTQSCEMSGSYVQADCYFAMYPYSADVEYKDGKFVNVAIPATQEVSAAQFDPKADILAGYTTSDEMTFTFRHIGSKLGFKVADDNITEIEIECSEYICGTADVALSASKDAIPVADIKSGRKTVTLTCADGFEKGKVYYATVFPTSWNSTIKATCFTTASKKAYVTYNGRIEPMERNTRNLAAPPAEKKGIVYADADDFVYDPEIIEPMRDASEIIFDYERNVDATGLQCVKDDDDMKIYTSGDKFYVISDKEITFYASLNLMFYWVEAESIVLNNFNTTEECLDMDGMFASCDNLSKIYVGNGFKIAPDYYTEDMFSGCYKLVGGNGTVYSNAHYDSEYARIDKDGEPGYFTAIE